MSFVESQASRKSGGPGIHLRPLQAEHAPALLDLQVRNRAFFGQYGLPRAENFLTLAGQQDMITGYQERAAKDQGYGFGIFLDETQALIGSISLAPVARGPVQEANVGYVLDEAHGGKGYATAALRLVLAFAFGQLGLHRVKAGVMPRNVPSQRVLEKAGFRREGLMKGYLRVNDVWEDHLLYALTAEEWPLVNAR